MHIPYVTVTIQDSRTAAAKFIKFKLKDKRCQHSETHNHGSQWTPVTMLTTITYGNLAAMFNHKINGEDVSKHGNHGNIMTPKYIIINVGMSSCKVSVISVRF
jgi:hypothetical protein